jgi:hypothetical protein
MAGHHQPGQGGLACSGIAENDHLHAVPGSSASPAEGSWITSCSTEQAVPKGSIPAGITGRFHWGPAKATSASRSRQRLIIAQVLGDQPVGLKSCPVGEVDLHAEDPDDHGDGRRSSSSARAMQAPMAKPMGPPISSPRIMRRMATPFWSRRRSLGGANSFCHWFLRRDRRFRSRRSRGI